MQLILINLSEGTNDSTNRKLQRKQTTFSSWFPPTHNLPKVLSLVLSTVQKVNCLQIVQDYRVATFIAMRVLQSLLLNSASSLPLEKFLHTRQDTIANFLSMRTYPLNRWNVSELFRFRHDITPNKTIRSHVLRSSRISATYTALVSHKLPFRRIVLVSRRSKKKNVIGKQIKKCVVKWWGMLCGMPF